MEFGENGHFAVALGSGNEVIGMSDAGDGDVNSDSTRVTQTSASVAMSLAATIL